MKKMILLWVTLILITSAMQSQVTIGSLTPPNEDSLLDLKETAGGTSTKGLLLPRVSLQSTSSPSPLTNHEQGMFVYNTVTVNDVTPGIYYNDGNEWKNIFTDETTANNGLTMSGETVQLGGALTKATKIDNGSYTLEISGTTGTTTISSPLAITSGNPGIGKVLQSDASGNTAWGSIIATANAGTMNFGATDPPIHAAPSSNYSYTTYSVSCPPGRSMVYAGFNVRNTSTYGGYVTVALATSATTFTQFTTNTSNPNSQGYAPSLAGFALMPNFNGSGNYTASLGEATFYVNNTGTANITLYLWALVQGSTTTANTALNNAVTLSHTASENFIICAY